MSAEKEKNATPELRKERRHETFKKVRENLPAWVVAGAGLSLGASLVFWYLRRNADKDVQPEIEEIAERALSEIEAKSGLGIELATLCVIRERIAPDLEELAERKKEGEKVIGMLEKIWRFSGLQPGARRVEEFFLAASIKALQGVESFLKTEGKSKQSPTTQSEPPGQLASIQEEYPEVQ